LSFIPIIYLLRFLFFCGLVWVVFFNISANPSVDALAYALGVVRGSDYIYVHHLLHGLVGRFVWVPLLGTFWQSKQLVDGYTWLAISNGIGFLLLVFGANLHLARRGQAIHPAVLMLAAAWGVLRFSVEFEAYIWPLVAAMGALLLLERRQFLGAGACLALALLYHQLAIFWLLPAAYVVYRSYGLRPLGILLAPLAILPLVYGLVWAVTNGGSGFIPFVL
jgi:hypothetical protein